ncbi:hypothetical protein evm_013355 [Chilo suppressalis]|nr:hypothetical protein evm_013355 [Chilo suppressalis]
MAIIFSAVGRHNNILSKFASCDGNFTEIMQQVLSKIPCFNDKMTYSHGHYLFHYIVADGYCYFCITDKLCQRSRAFLFLNEIQRRFLSRGKEDFTNILAEEMYRYGQDYNTITIRKGEIDELNKIGVDSSESLLGEKILLVKNADNLTFSSITYVGKTPEKIVVTFKESRIYIIIIVIIILVLGIAIYIFSPTSCIALIVIDDTSAEEQDSIRAEFDESYFHILALHRQLVPSNESQLNQSLPTALERSSTYNLKLPKLQLPTFSGHIKSWPEYYDIFNSLVHNNESLTDTERMHYLVSSLSGDALGLIRTYPVQGIFYREAYETLIARYRNKRELAFTCWKEMQNINFKINSPFDFRRTLDLFNENLNILKGLNLPTDNWDFILCYLILSKLDTKTRCAFEQLNSTMELPSYQDLKSFLYAKCEALVRDTHFSSNDYNKPRCSEKVQPTKVNSFASRNKSTSVFLSNSSHSSKQLQSSNVTKSNSNALSQSSAHPIVTCSFCSENHSVNLCHKFAQTPVSERIEFVKSHRLCFNCLRPSHTVSDCKSIFRCQKCRHRHHTLLHEDVSVVSSENQSNNNNQTPNQVRVLTSLGDGSVVLLSTAYIQIRDQSGIFQNFRALIDSGSQAHFITERALHRLGITHTSRSRQVRGLGQSTASVTGNVDLQICANGKPLFTINALTLPHICGKMPSVHLDQASWHHVRNLPLADPTCHKPGPIDLLLGAEVFASLLLPGRVDGGPKQPSALNSVFGWLLVGSVGCKDEEVRSFFINKNDVLYEEVQKLWELDSFNFVNSKHLTPEEDKCENIFANTHSRDSTYRYVVTLPFKDEEKEHSFPGSRDTALRCLYSLEKRLSKNSDLRLQYNEFMKDYLDSGHMSPVSIENLKCGKYYIPHHCVVRPESVTTKLRVVFNASAKDSRGISLNDTLLIGPKLQTNIVEILLNFRVHFVVFMADMRQMYRQIVVSEADRDYQRIFWRFDTNQPVKEYRLNTVTYGMSSAPFLACRTIKQLVFDEGKELPLGSKILSSDLYIDDLVTGFESLETAKKAKSEVIDLLQRGHFELRKWASNEPKLLEDLPPEHCLTGPVSLDTDENSFLKVLGLRWDPWSDSFLFAVKPRHVKCTKRNILSEVARIFDPLGFLSPLTLIAKVLVQRLWVLNVGWDEDPPTDVVRFWNRYLDQIHLLETLKIPRCVSVISIISCELHGFSDSSETGYGAVIYLRLVNVSGEVRVFFLCSKARVAPTKSTSLPRLELCAAVLLIDLLKFVLNSYSHKFSITQVYAWSDSMVVLAWLRSHPSQWQTFVANRVAYIQEVLPIAKWNHVFSEDNPADFASRGQFPSDLVNNTLWWAGPSWLLESSDRWPQQINLSEEEDMLLERKPPRALLIHDNGQSDQISIFDTLLRRYSCIRKIQRILCWWLRYASFLRNQRSCCSDLFLTRTELHSALMMIVKHVQSFAFVTEIRQLKEGHILSKQMRKLNPFLDPSGVLRVGGRLARSGLEFEHKHPASIPRDSRFTYLIIEAFHRENCHAGVNTMQYLLNQQFWIISAKRAIRHCLSKCVSCYKTKSVPLEPYMSDLPAIRINQVKPFSVVGTDYGGPFRIKLGKHRGAKLGKAYLSFRLPHHQGYSSRGCFRSLI